MGLKIPFGTVSFLIWTAKTFSWCADLACLSAKSLYKNMFRLVFSKFGFSIATKGGRSFHVKFEFSNAPKGGG